MMQSPQESNQGKPKKSPAQKRAEKAAERASWSQEEIDKAFAAAGGTPKSLEDKPKHPGGRPSKRPTIDLVKVEKLAAAGLTGAQMAVALDISIDTITEWKKSWPEFSAALKGGKDTPDDKVERSLFERATGYSHVEDKMFFDAQTGSVVVQPTIKHYPPDPASMIFWLKNRRPERWREQKPDAPDQNQTQQALARIADALEARDG